jgi:type I restriction enzyme S subunit
MCDVEIPIPDINVQRAIASIFDCYTERKNIAEKLNVQIKDICPILIKGSIDEARMEA